MKSQTFRFFVVVGLAFTFLSCGSRGPATGEGITAFRGATVIANPADSPIENAVLLVQNGKIASIGAAAEVAVPEGAHVVDLAGKTVMPGLISTHVHISDVNGLAERAYTEQNTLRQLGVFARYGVTTVLSLGGEKAPAFAARDAQNTATLARARIFLSGDVIVASTPEEARAKVAEVAALKPDWIKIRVDDNLGTTQKMKPEVYRAIIEETHTRGLRLAAHIFYLDDAKQLLRAGADMIAHSVRDKDIDEEFISLMKARNIPYCPTLTRELSTFVYAEKPAFFDDPFFQKEADAAVVESLLSKERQKSFQTSRAAAGYREALEVAKRNLKKASEAGLLIVMGTDAGPVPERFQGYFEHLEMQMMADAGLTPKQILESATTNAAKALAKEDIGVLREGAWADFVVLEKSPLEAIGNTKTITEVRIAGNPAEGREAAP